MDGFEACEKISEFLEENGLTSMLGVKLTPRRKNEKAIPVLESGNIAPIFLNDKSESLHPRKKPQKKRHSSNDIKRKPSIHSL